MRKQIFRFGENKRVRSGERLIFICGLLLFCAFLLLQMAARNISGFGEWYAVTIYPVLESSIGRFFGLLPFSAAEFLLYGIFAGFLIYGISHLNHWKKILNRGFLLIALLLFVYTANCGINYYRRPFSQFLSYETRNYSAEELRALLKELTSQVNLTQAARRKAGAAAIDAQPGMNINEESVKAMEKLGTQYPMLGGFYPKPKELFFSEILSWQQLSGIYSPFTIEANYNGDMTPCNIPHTVCHELSHLKGFMREDEANFIGFLACIGSDDAEFRYSGYLSAWIYAGNALAVYDRESYADYWMLLNEDTKKELMDNSNFWEQYDSRAAEVSEAINDTYLKANSQTDGVKSYGRVVDLLLGWFHQ